MISPCYNSCSSKTVNLKECVAAVAAIIEKELFIEWKATTGIAN